MDGKLDESNPDDIEFMIETVGSVTAGFLLDAYHLATDGESISFDVIKHICENEDCDPIEILGYMKSIRGEVNENIENTRD